MPTHTMWFASPNPKPASSILRYARTASGAAETLKMLTDAKQVLLDRGSQAARDRKPSWNGPRLLVLVEDVSRLFADEAHGKEIYELAQTLTRHGQKVNVRLELQW